MSYIKEKKKKKKNQEEQGQELQHVFLSNMAIFFQFDIHQIHKVFIFSNAPFNY